MEERTIETVTHGRYLVESNGPGRPLLAGFHGYAESAEIELQRLRSIPGCEKWTLVSVQGLHRFYRGRSNDVVAGWMTRQDRDLAIADNIAYTSAVIDAALRETSATTPLVLSGFSQGVAMAFRCAVHLSRRVAAVIELAGDVPPELSAAELSRIPAVLIGCGSRDEWYTRGKAVADERRLKDAGVRVEVVNFEGGHEWTPDFAQSVSQLLQRLTG